MLTLHAATDIYDEIGRTNRFPTIEDLQQLMRYLKSLKIRRLEWIVDTIWTLYDSDSPCGFDLLAEAVKAAHQEEIELHAVYKPWEGALGHLVLPSTLPQSQGYEAWQHASGNYPCVRPFCAQHEQMNLSRMPGQWESDAPVRAIRLIKNDDGPVDINPDDVSLWASPINGRWERYDGPVTISQHTGWQPVFPRPSICRVIEFTDLQLPANHRFIEIRFDEQPAVDFTNEVDAIAQLLDESGQILPSTTATGAASDIRLLQRPILQKLLRYFNQTECSSALDEEISMLDDYDAKEPQSRQPTFNGKMLRQYLMKNQGLLANCELHKRRHIAIMRGKTTHATGMLHPIYPEVRRHWLDEIQFCLDRGVDGIDIRMSTHMCPHEAREFGFNPPVLEATGGSTNRALVAKVNGDALTQFHGEAAEHVHNAGKLFGIHLVSNFLGSNDQYIGGPISYNFDYQWETWVREFADYAVFRGAMGLHQSTLQERLDHFACVCSEANVPLIYQVNRRAIAAEEPGPWTEWELKWIGERNDIAAFQVYETAFFAYTDEDGSFKANAAIEELCQKYGR